jgi:hypothetical protein
MKNKINANIIKELKNANPQKYSANEWVAIKQFKNLERPLTEKELDSIGNLMIGKNIEIIPSEAEQMMDRYYAAQKRAT